MFNLTPPPCPAAVVVRRRLHTIVRDVEPGGGGAVRPAASIVYRWPRRRRTLHYMRDLRVAATAFLATFAAAHQKTRQTTCDASAFFFHLRI